MPVRMHVDGLEIDETLVRRLLAEQFPRWVEQQLRRIESGGAVNAIFRLGDGAFGPAPASRGADRAREHG